jgi:hypothetical protein
MTRRLAAAILGALVLLTGLVPGPADGPFGTSPARAATSGTPGISVQPSCVPLDTDPETTDTRDVTVAGHGFEPGSSVPIRLFSLESEPVAFADVDEVGAFRTSVSVPLPAEATGGNVYAGEPDDGPNAEAYLEAPCRPALTVDPTCTDPGDPFDLAFVATGFQPDTEIRVALAVPDREIVSEPLVTDGSGRLEYTYRDIEGLPDGFYYAAAAQGLGGGQSMARAAVSNPWIAAAAFEVPCPTRPTLTVSPDCAPPGAPQDRYDVTVQGSGFESGEVTITWDTGGSNETFQARVGEDGSFATRIDPWQRGPMRIRVRAVQRYSFIEVSGIAAYSPDARPRRVATTTFTVPCEPAVLTLGPDCDRPALRGEDERRMEIGVTGSGIRLTSIVRRAPVVELVFDAQGAAADVVEPERFPAQLDADGTLPLTTITPLARPVGEYRVALLVDGEEVAGAAFRVPCEDARPSLRPVQPDCLPLAPGRPGVAELRVRGRRFYPGPVEVIFGVQGARDLTNGTVLDDGTFDIRLPVTGREPGTYQAQGRQRDSRGTVVARAFRDVVVPCVDPVLTISPRSGPAGFATMVSGTGFPLDTTITLRWDKGLTAARPIEVTTDATGAFRVSVFLLPHDIEGPRTMTAATPDDPDAFPGVTADYLVVPGSGQPPGSVDRR